MVTEAELWTALEDVKDPEIPVVSVVDLGIIQDVQMLDDDSVKVEMTPTFAGCPAIAMMRDAIAERISEMGVDVTVELTLDPPWTSDRISERGRQKLKEIGLAPPARHDGTIEIDLALVVRCPYCESEDTTMESYFGPTLCRAIYYCNSCKQSFEKFKAL